MTDRFRSIVCIALLGLVVSACAPLVKEEPPPEPEVEKPEPPPAPPPKEVEPQPVAVEGIRYEIDPQRSDLIILVYRSGKLAHLGHNHLISSKQVEGTVVLGDPLLGSRVELRVPVAGLVVDDPSLRSEAGAEFGTRPKPEDVEATRRNMLGDRVLNAAVFPAVEARGTVVAGELPWLELELELEIRGTRQRQRSKVQVEFEGDTLLAQGEIRLRQSDFGIEPFSVLMGALAVEDEVDVRYWLVATRR